MTPHDPLCPKSEGGATPQPPGLTPMGQSKGSQRTKIGENVYIVWSFGGGCRTPSPDLSLWVFRLNDISYLLVLHTSAYMQTQLHHSFVLFRFNSVLNA